MNSIQVVGLGKYSSRLDPKMWYIGIIDVSSVTLARLWGELLEIY